eukprot:m.263798 g.263798  ORF g.263798 m.263798 type:complete len:78 (+) comp40459_c0_seq1:440-673(+)
MAYIPLALFNPYYSIVVFSFVAISNPLVFTLFSKPFYKSIIKFWIYFRFKCGKAISLANLSNDEDSPFQTKLPQDTE